jgi:serine/threonine-protein kinase RsbW
MASEAPIQCSMVVESKASALSDPCRQILSGMEEKGFSKDDVFAVHLALEEAFLNAVKHGNKMDPDKTVTIDYTVDHEKVEIRIRDEGTGFNPQSVPDPRVGENLYRPEGRGLLLMNAYMHVFEYNERGNGVRMIRYKNRPIPMPSDTAAG